MEEESMAKKRKQRRRRRGQPVKQVNQLGTIERASAIVAHVLVHFGAGYGGQRHTEDPVKPPPNLEIFKMPADSSGFHHLLLESTLRNFDNIPFNNKAVRDQICFAAFEHGVSARKLAVEEKTPTINLRQILETLEDIKQRFCPGPSGGAGGGQVCDI
jgi:hypothetical protein